MTLKKTVLFFFIITMAFICNKDSLAIDNNNNSNFERPDYSKTVSRASRTDSISHPVDVFYVFPTIYSEEYPLNDFIRSVMRVRNVLDPSTLFLMQHDVSSINPFYALGYGYKENLGYGHEPSC
jgi:hypothetical protein